ncbi:HupE/UreJ family protein [Methylobacter sp. Wu8]|uniref:HupE/UreJ family protein n=1 Tax=Methylobacter sp. Wu8 TaxID=3118457 RepID=UPI002F2CC790
MKKIIVVAGLIAFSQAASAHTGLLPTGGFSHGFQHPFLGLDHFLVMLGLGLWASSQSRLLARQALGVFLLFMTIGALFGLTGFGFAYVETGILVSLLLVGVALSFPIVPAITAIKLRQTLVPKLQLGNPVSEAPASRSGKLELPAPNSQAGAWELALTKSLNLIAARGNEAGFYGKVIILTSVAAFASMHGLAHGGEMPVDASAYAYIAGIVSATAVLYGSGLALGLAARHVNATGLLRVYGTLTGLVGAWLLFA